MVCTNVNPCVQGSKSNVVLSIPRINPSGRVEAGQTVTISVDVTDVSWILGETVVVDVVDMDSGICIYNEGIPWLDKGVTKVISFQTIMPNKNLNLRISASSWVVGIFPLPSYWGCEDVKEFSIQQQYTQYNCVNNQCTGPLQTGQFNSREECIASGCAPPPPPVKKYSCPGQGKTCVENPNGVSLAECQAQGCTGGGGNGGGVCGTGKISLFGTCYKNQDVFMVAGAAILVYMFTKR